MKEFQDTQTEREEWQRKAREWEESWNESREGEAIKGQEVVP